MCLLYDIFCFLFSFIFAGIEIARCNLTSISKFLTSAPPAPPSWWYLKQSNPTELLDLSIYSQYFDCFNCHFIKTWYSWFDFHVCIPSGLSQFCRSVSQFAIHLLSINCSPLDPSTRNLPHQVTDNPFHESEAVFLFHHLLFTCPLTKVSSNENTSVETAETNWAILHRPNSSVVTVSDSQ